MSHNMNWHEIDMWAWVGVVGRGGIYYLNDEIGENWGKLAVKN